MNFSIIPRSLPRALKRWRMVFTEGIRVESTASMVAGQDFIYAMRDDVMGFDDHGGPYWHHAIYARLSQSIAHH